MKRFGFILSLILLAAIWGCTTSNDANGGSEAGNPGFRDITGEVGSAASASYPTYLPIRQALAAESCPADSLIATDSTGESTVGDIEGDCSFTLTLATGKSYAIHFILEDEFVASMIFQASDTLQSTVFYLSDGDNAVDLGIIAIADGIAEGDTSPYEQNDRDDDGENDFDDADDDDDGVDDDDDYVDCNDDGYYEDESECDDEIGDDSSGEGED